MGQGAAEARWRLSGSSAGPGRLACGGRRDRSILWLLPVFFSRHPPRFGALSSVDPLEDAQGLVAEKRIAVPGFPARSGIVGGQEDLVDIEDGIVGHTEGLAAAANIPGIGAQAIAIDRKAIVLPNRAA